MHEWSEATFNGIIINSIESIHTICKFHNAPQYAFVHTLMVLIHVLCA